jgi:lipoteichoic acid synthase
MKHLLPAVVARRGHTAAYLLLFVPMLIRLVALGRPGPRPDLGTHLLLIAWELPVLVALAGVFEYSRRLSSQGWRLAVRLAAELGWAALMADALVFHLFGGRLAIPDVIRYGRAFGEIAAYLGGPLIAGLVVAAGFLLLINIRGGVPRPTVAQESVGAGWRRRRPVPHAFLLVIALAGALIGSTAAPPDGDLYAWKYQNWLSLNTQNSLYRSYSPAFLDSVRSTLPPRPDCGMVVDPGNAPDLLVVLLESFSSGFTPMYGGRRSAYPEFERISRDGLRFTRFLANGFTTEHGLIGILGGRLPVFPAEAKPFSLTGNTSFSGHYGLAASLPACAGSLGYHTEFLTSGDLSFTNKGAWLKSMGFARVEGHNAPHYDGLPRRRMFSAVSDSALYARAADRMRELRERGQPFMLVLEGVESHGPYSGDDGMIAAMRSADGSLGWLYDQLVASGFLESGLALLVSDHRVQVAVTEDEWASFGNEAPARVPALVLGKGIVAGVDEAPRHHLDVLPTLLRYMGASIEPAPLAVPLTEPPGTRCIPWLHHGRRDEISAICADEYVRIRLEAERTRVVEGPSTEWSDELISEIHRARIDGSAPARQANRYRGLEAGSP